MEEAFRRHRFHAYLRGASASLVAKALSTVSAFVSLWFLTQVLSPQEFGSFAVAMAWVTLVALTATLGLDTSLLYVLARHEPLESHMGGGGVFRWILVRAALSGFAGAGLLLFAALGFGVVSGWGDFARWLAMLSPLIAMSTISSAFEAWYQANHRVVEMLILPRIVDVSRTLFLGVVWWVAAGDAGVVLAYLGSWLLAPLLWLLLPSSRATFSEAPRALKRFQVIYGFKLMLARLINNLVERLDLLMLGAMVPAAAVANFAVATRLATPVGAPKDLFGPVFTPRIRWLASGGKSRLVAREYHLVQHYYFGAALALAALLTAGGPWILRLYHGYGTAYPIFLLLVAAYLVKMAFGPATSFLAMSGGSGTLLGITIAALFTMAGLNLVFIPRLGATGAAMGTILGMLLINALTAYLIWRRHGIVTVSFQLALLLLGVIGTTVAGNIGVISPTVVGMLIGLALLEVGRRIVILHGTKD